MDLSIGKIYIYIFFNLKIYTKYYAVLLKILLKKNTQAKYSDRRYDSVKYENGIKYGNENTCPNQSKVDSWWRYLFWHCSYCMCTCDDHSANSDRYFNLRDVTSNINRNM